jgi:hypothetical protein
VVAVEGNSLGAVLKGDLSGARFEFPEWYVGPHGSMPSPRPLFGGQVSQSHHGVNSVWLEANYAGFDADAAPAILMRNDPFHNATRGVFNTIRSEIAGQQGVSPRGVDWAKVSPGTAWRIAEEQFNAGQVPQWARNEYYRQLNRYLDSLQK